MAKSVIYGFLLVMSFFIVSSCAATAGERFKMVAVDNGGGDGGSNEDVTYDGVLDMLSKCYPRKYFDVDYYEMNFGGQAKMDTDGDGLLSGNELCVAWGMRCMFVISSWTDLDLTFTSGGGAGGAHAVWGLGSCASTSGFVVPDSSGFGAMCC